MCLSQIDKKTPKSPFKAAVTARAHMPEIPPIAPPITADQETQTNNAKLSRRASSRQLCFVCYDGKFACKDCALIEERSKKV
jgi:hypothetical protein